MTRLNLGAARADIPIRNSIAQASRGDERQDASRGVWPVGLAVASGLVAGQLSGTLAAQAAVTVAAGGADAPSALAPLSSWGENAFLVVLEGAPLFVRNGSEPTGGPGGSGALAGLDGIAGSAVPQVSGVAVAALGFPGSAVGAPPWAAGGSIAGFVAAGQGDVPAGDAGGGASEAVPSASLAALLGADPMQLNASFSDQDAISLSVSITYIGEIVDSIVFLGPTVAMAGAYNFAPLSQVNAGLGAVGAGGQVNLAVTDNDAIAVAFAGTIIGSAENSVIVLGGSEAAATALNVAGVEQGNIGVFAALEDEAGSVSQLNGSIADNDAIAAADSVVLAGAAPEGSGLDAGAAAALLAILEAPDETAPAPAALAPSSDAGTDLLEADGHLDDAFA
jgi:hypothetical protein